MKMLEPRNLFKFSLDDGSSATDSIAKDPMNLAWSLCNIGLTIHLFGYPLTDYGFHVVCFAK